MVLMYHLMKEEDYKHTWVLPKNAFYIKLYLWYWMADASEITFCKLFWGYSLMIPFFPFRVMIGVGRTVGAVINGILDHTAGARKLRRERKAELAAAEKLLRERDERQAKLKRITDGPTGPTMPRTVDTTNGTTVALLKQAEQKKKPKPPKIYHGRIQAGVKVKLETTGREPEWIIGSTRYGGIYGNAKKIEHTFTEPGPTTIQLRTLDDENGEYFIIDYTFPVYEGPSLPTKALERASDFGSLVVMYGTAPARFIGRWLKRGGITAAIAAPFFGLYELVSNWGSFGPSSLTWLGHAGSTVGPWAIVGGIGIVLAVLIVWAFIVFGIGVAIKDVVMKPAAEGVTHGTLGFFKMLKIGYKSVKGNTCPRVLVEGDEEPETA
jgi:hypothetical protein